MKIRRGFVSNSSSASYIVTIEAPYKTENDLLKDIYNTCNSAMEELEDEYFNRMERYREEELHISNIETRHQMLLSLFGSQRELRSRLLTSDDGSIPRLLEEDTCIEPTRLFLGHEGITLVQDSITGKFILTAFTSMHNSFLNINRLLTTIYFEFLTNMGGATFKMESDN